MVSPLLPKGRARVLVSALCGVAAGFALALVPTPAQATTAGNPLAGGPWGIYKGSGDGLWPAYEQATGNQKKLLAREALQPRVRRYGPWIATSKIAAAVRADIVQEQNGNTNTLVWVSIMRLWPSGESAYKQPLSAAAQQSYRNWIDAAARGIGHARVAMILEPDLPVAINGWRPAVRYSLVRYAVQKFTALTRTTIYLDDGSSDWLSVAAATSLLERTGIGRVRGFALGSSHHVSVGSELVYGRAIVLALRRAGYAPKHFVIDTSDNGHPYTNAQFHAKYPSGNVENPPACQTMSERVCVSLGIPPTTDVANTRWPLSATQRRIASGRCDAYEWAGKPWKIDNDATFSLPKALAVARTDPFA